MVQVATFLVLFAFWVLLSGKFDGFHLTLGAISSVIVTYFSGSLFFPEEKAPSLRKAWGFLLYLPWLLWEIILANLQVTYIVLHPRMRELIDPQLVRFQTQLKSPLAKVTLAHSITLTPGTITVGVYDREFTVYALTRAAAESLPGDMEKRVQMALEPKEER